MPRLTSESFDQYYSSNLGGYKFVNQGILYLLILVYIFHYIQYLMHCCELFVKNFIIFVSPELRASLFAVKRLVI
jgi:hypothetical protein